MSYSLADLNCPNLKKNMTYYKEKKNDSGKYDIFKDNIFVS